MLEKLILFSGKEYDKDIIKYGIIVIRNGVLSILIILGLAIIEKKLQESLIYLLCNLLIYTKIGGYHAKTPIGCMVLTIMTWKIALYYSAICIKIDILFWIIIFCVYTILVVKYAPVLHPNKARFGEIITVKQRMEAGARLFIGYILIMVFWNIHKQEYAGVLMMSISEIIISMLIGKEIYKNYEERSC